MRAFVNLGQVVLATVVVITAGCRTQAVETCDSSLHSLSRTSHNRHDPQASSEGFRAGNLVKFNGFVRFVAICGNGADSAEITVVLENGSDTKAVRRGNPDCNGPHGLDEEIVFNALASLLATAYATQVRVEATYECRFDKEGQPVTPELICLELLPR